MKKFLAAAFLAVTLTTTAFAADPSQVNSRTLENFNREFKEASNVNWLVKSNFVKASFILNEKRIEAYYDLDANFLGWSQAITIEKLPTGAKRAFAKKYADYTVKEAIQFEGLDDTVYYISAENDKDEVVLKVQQGSLSVFKKTSKDR